MSRAVPKSKKEPIALDSQLRALVQRFPRDFLALAFSKRRHADSNGAPRIRRVRLAESSLPAIRRRVDSLLEIETDGGRATVHFEIQAQRDEHLGWRLLDYVTRVHLRPTQKRLPAPAMPVLPVVLYLGPDAVPSTPPPYRMKCQGREVLTLHYVEIRLWEVDFEKQRFLDRPALAALSVLERAAGPRLHLASMLRKNIMELDQAWLRKAFDWEIREIARERMEENARKAVRKALPRAVREAEMGASMRSLKVVAESKGVRWNRRWESAVRRRKSRTVDGLLRRLATCSDATSARRLLTQFAS
jgi:hypothetical protein